MGMDVYRIHNQCGCFRDKIEGGALTSEQKERALRRLFRKKGWDIKLLEE